MQSKKTEIWVGIFMVIGLCSLLFLCLKVADVKSLGSEPTYRLYASFDNIGGLKVRSPIKIGGVVVGRVANIQIDNKTLAPVVEMQIQQQFNALASTTTASILTSGLLGEQYIGLTPGFMDEEMGTEVLKDGDRIEDTKSAIVLEDLIGKFLYSQSNK